MKKLAYKGLSLIEILLALFVTLLLTGLVYQFSAGLYQKNEALVIRDQFIAAFEFARMQALERHESMYLASLNNESSWNKGIQLYALNGKDQQELIHQWPWHHPNWSLQWQGAKSKTLIPISYQLGHALANGRFIMKNKQGKSATIIVNRIGRIRFVDSL